MQKNNWKDRMNALLKKRGWDIKDWHRATGLSQWQLENLMGMDVSMMDTEQLENIYMQAKESKLDKKMMRFEEPVMIAVWAHKGGSGKTSTATNLCYELALKGYNVLAIDTDSQSDMTSVLYPQYLTEPEVSFYNAFLSQDDFVKAGYIRHTDYVNLDIIAGSAECESLESTMSTMPESFRNRMWKKCMETIREENYYDFVILDMDKTGGTMNRSILREANYVLAPVESAMFSVKSVPSTIAQVEEMAQVNPKLKLLGIFYVKVDLRKKAALAENMELVERLSPGGALKTYIKNDSNVDNSQKEHMPTRVYNKKSPAAIQTLELTEEILEKIRKDYGL